MIKLATSNECSIIGWDKIGPVVKRKYSAACFVKYYNDLLIGFVFCTERAMPS